MLPSDQLETLKHSSNQTQSNTITTINNNTTKPRQTQKKSDKDKDQTNQVKKSKEYVPSYRSGIFILYTQLLFIKYTGSWSLLIALYKNTVIATNPCEYMTKNELIDAAAPLCDSSFVQVVLTFPTLIHLLFCDCIIVGIQILLYCME
jgi:hypothetical protein